MEQVRQMLESTQLKYINISRHGVVSMITTEPSRDQLFEATKMSDFRNDLEGGRSWLDGIETGLSGLGSFLFREEGLNTTESRSGTGLQLKGGKKSEGAKGGTSTGGAAANQRSRYTRTSYISGILRNFKKRIEKLKRTVIK